MKNQLPACDQQAEYELHSQWQIAELFCFSMHSPNLMYYSVVQTSFCVGFYLKYRNPKLYPGYSIPQRFV